MHFMINVFRLCMILLLINDVHASQQSSRMVNTKLQTIEKQYHLKIGLYALDTNSEQVITHHADDRFPFQSTFKFMGVSALLAQDDQKHLLQKKVFMHPRNIVFWHPVSGKYLNQYVTLQTLAEAAISYSDNTAINIIIHELGGLKVVNKFAHRMGNTSFNLAHYEVQLNSNPQDTTDTSTPKEMALSIQKILLGTTLTAKNKSLLLDWMKNNTTGYHRIRAGVPLGWSVADKTGSGSYGIANDIGIAWSPACKPIVLSIFTVSEQPNAKPNDAVITKITQILFEEFEQHHACYKATRLT